MHTACIACALRYGHIARIVNIKPLLGINCQQRHVAVGLESVIF